VDGSEIYALAGKSEPTSSGGVTIAPDRASSQQQPQRVATSGTP
jgi:hypothetical protein